MYLVDLEADYKYRLQLILMQDERKELLRRKVMLSKQHQQQQPTPATLVL